MLPDICVYILLKTSSLLCLNIATKLSSSTVGDISTGLCVFKAHKVLVCVYFFTYGSLRAHIMAYLFSSVSSLLIII